MLRKTALIMMTAAMLFSVVSIAFAAGCPITESCPPDQGGGAINCSCRGAGNCTSHNCSPAAGDGPGEGEICHVVCDCTGEDDDSEAWCDGEQQN
ncbi:hypothetical protein ACFL7D_01440 [candidate division KSB1 bacterium]